MKRVWRRLTYWAASFVVLLGTAGMLASAAGVFVVQRYADELPDYHALADYTPPTVTRIHAGDGRLLAEFAHQKRVFVPIGAIPERLAQAFLAAEDQNFYEHFGIDLIGVLRATIDNVERLAAGVRPQGASTITQQVAKNFLLTNELSLERKIKEALLAMRIEQTFSKDHILELYLNEIFLGKRSYGVAAAALNYFNKSLDELTLAESAYLAGLPKAPSRYDPKSSPEEAEARRRYVLNRMVEDGLISVAVARLADAEPLTTRRRAPTELARADFFTEEVRRTLVAGMGSEGFYEGGLSIRTTVLPSLQAAADRALRSGLSAYDRRYGWRGPLGRIEEVSPDPPDESDEAKESWQERLARFDPGFKLLDWHLALVREVTDEEARIGFADGSKGALPLERLRWAREQRDGGELGPPVERVSQVLSVGDVILVERLEEPEGPEQAYALRQRPEVEGALVALDPHNGRVLAMSGGFSFRQSQFNRATQALRQPGSAFKPFVYMAALEAGYTPNSIILDAPLVVDQGPDRPKWKPANYAGRFHGPSTLRLGVEKSRNLMTVRLAQEVGMAQIVDVARRFGIGRRMNDGLASALGSNETDLLSLTAAYGMLVNGGRRIEPSLIERIQNRFGETIARRDERPCEACTQAAYEGGLPPRLPDMREQVADPRHAYQMVRILEGVIDRGTGSRARNIGKPIAGKTGTTNDSRDAWFVGFSPDLAVGVYVGFDQPRSLGEDESGSTVALPIWRDFIKTALAEQASQPFRTPSGVRLVRIDAETGLLPGPATRSIIAEAFIPGTEPDERSIGRVEPTVLRDDNEEQPLPGRTIPAAPESSGLY